MRWIAIVVVLAALCGGTAACAGEDQPRPASVRVEKTSALYAPIAARQSDPRPLTQGEVFPSGRLGVTLTQGAVTLTRGPVTETADCAGVVWGSAPVTGCSQALRAVYSSPGLSGQFLIFNMPDGATADALAAAFEKDAFVRLAPGQPAVDGGWAQVRALGHFVTVSWIATVGDGKPDLTPGLLALDSAGRFVQDRVLQAG